MSEANSSAAPLLWMAVTTTSLSFLSLEPVASELPCRPAHVDGGEHHILVIFEHRGSYLQRFPVVIVDGGEHYLFVGLEHSVGEQQRTTVPLNSSKHHDLVCLEFIGGEL